MEIGVNLIRKYKYCRINVLKQSLQYVFIMDLSKEINILKWYCKYKQYQNSGDFLLICDL